MNEILNDGTTQQVPEISQPEPSLHLGDRLRSTQEDWPEGDVHSSALPSVRENTSSN